MVANRIGRPFHDIPVLEILDITADASRFVGCTHILVVRRPPQLPRGLGPSDSAIEGEARVRQAYGANYPRLQALMWPVRWPIPDSREARFPDMSQFRFQTTQWDLNHTFPGCRSACLSQL